MTDIDYVVLQIGEAGKPADFAYLLELLRSLPEETAVDLALGGYDEDDRELWDIPDARQYLLHFMAAAFAAGIPLERFLPQTQKLIQACAIVANGGKVTLFAETVDQTKADIEAYQARVQRKGGT